MTATRQDVARSLCESITLHLLRSDILLSATSTHRKSSFCNIADLVRSDGADQPGYALRVPRPTFRRRRLARQLTRLREEADVSHDQVLKELGFSRAKLSRIEHAEVGVSIADAKSMARLYGMDEASIERIGEDARLAKQHGWWHKYSGDLAQAQADYLEIEDEAASFDQFAETVIPGLLQTEGYARALISAWPDVPPGRVDYLVRLRMQRQARLKDGTLKLWVIMDEAALRRPVGIPEARREQLEHLAEQAEDNPNVTVQVIPFSAGSHPSQGVTFQVVNFTGYDPVVFTDTGVGGLVFEDEDSVNAYRALFDKLRMAAADHRPSLAIIRSYFDAKP